MKIIILYSGGKDSQASLIYAVKKYGVDKCEAVFCDTGWENPITYDHIKTTCETLRVKLVVAKSKRYNGMIDLATQKKRFPSTKARFCTEELKSKPAIDYILSLTEHLIVIEGIRKDESFSRSKLQNECTYFKYYFSPYQSNELIIEKLTQRKFLTLEQKRTLKKAQDRLKIGKNDEKFHTYRKKDVFEFCKNYNADKVRPFFDSTAEEVISYIKENRQDVNPLYYQGFARVGCFPCIMSKHSEVKQLLKIYPERFEHIKELEKEVGSSFFKIDYVPPRFQTGVCHRTGKSFTKAVDIEKYLNDKDATLDLFEEDSPGCLSAYNLCE